MEKVKKSLVKKEYLVPFVLVTSLFFLWGFAHAILDVLNKHFQEALVMTKAHSALIQATMYTGYFTMAIPAGLFINKYGYRQGVVFGLILYGIGSLLFIPSEQLMSFNFFLFSLFVIGCGLTFLESLRDGAWGSRDGSQPFEPGTIFQRVRLYLCAGDRWNAVVFW